MVDVVEASLDIGIEHKFGFVSDALKDSSDRVVTRASWSKAVAVGFKDRFPWGFYGEFRQGLPRAFHHGWNTQWPFSSLPGLGIQILRTVVVAYGLPSGLGGLCYHGSRLLGGRISLHPLRPFFALVLLRHPPHSQQPRRLDS